MADRQERTDHRRCKPGQLCCPSQVFGTVIKATTGIYRVRCTGKFCKGPEGTVTFHMFRLADGKLLRTEQPSYRNPAELVG